MQEVNPFNIDEIVLSNDKELKRSLMVKLQEYRNRNELGPYDAPECQPFNLCKIAILAKLLTEGRVVRKVMLKELKQEYGDIATHYFFEAFGVIWAYVNGHIELVHGGTGLPK